MSKPSIVLVTPVLSDTRNGNWQTAHRWASMLSPNYNVTLTAQWPDDAASSISQRLGFHFASSAKSPAPVAMLALHAFKSSASIEAWSCMFPSRPLIVVLTGTDLYRDIESQPKAQASL